MYSSDSRKNAGSLSLGRDDEIFLDNPAIAARQHGTPCTPSERREDTPVSKN